MGSRPIRRWMPPSSWRGSRRDIQFPREPATPSPTELRRRDHVQRRCGSDRHHQRRHLHRRRRLQFRRGPSSTSLAGEPSPTAGRSPARGRARSIQRRAHRSRTRRSDAGFPRQHVPVDRRRDLRLPRQRDQPGDDQPAGSSEKGFYDDGTLDNFGTIIQTGTGNLDLHSDNISPTTLKNEAGALT